MGIFSDFQGQLTPQSVVQSSRNSNPSELSCMSSMPASMERIRWKTAEKKWRHCFSHHNPICYHGNQWLDLAEFLTHPSSHVCYHYLQIWKGSNQEQSRKSGDIIFPIISLWGFFRRSRAAYSSVGGPIRLKFQLVRALMHVFVTCKYEKDQMKTAEKKWRHCFLHYNPMGAFCCHGNQSFDPIWPKTLCSQSPTQMMLQIKFGCNRPIGLRDIHVWKCEHMHRRTHARTDGRRLDRYTISSPQSLRLRWAKKPVFSWSGSYYFFNQKFQ